MTEPEAHDPLLAALQSLPARDLEHARGERVRRSALAAFDRAHGLPGWVSPLVGVWSRFMVPAMLVSATVIYLHWAISFTNALYH